jgi:hypothetical protein
MDKNVSIVKVDKRHYRVIAQENWGLTKEQMKGNHVHHRIRRSDGGTNDPSNLYVCSPLYHDVVWHGGTGGFIGLAAEGGRIGGQRQPREVKRQNALKGIAKMPAAQRSRAGKKGAEVTNSRRTPSEHRRIAQIMRDKTPRKTRVKSGERARDEKLGMFGMSEEDRYKANVKGGKAGGKKAFDMGVGIHAMTKEDRKEAGRKGAKNRSHEDSVKGGKAAARTLWVDPDHPEIGAHNAGNLVQKQRSLGLPSGPENRARVSEQG